MPGSLLMSQTKRFHKSPGLYMHTEAKLDHVITAVFCDTLLKNLLSENINCAKKDLILHYCSTDRMYTANNKYEVCFSKHVNFSIIKVAPKQKTIFLTILIKIYFICKRKLTQHLMTSQCWSLFPHHNFLMYIDVINTDGWFQMTFQAMISNS